MKPIFTQIQVGDQDLNRVQANVSSSVNQLFNEFSIPVGSVILYGGNKDYGNWLLCDGRSLQQVQFQPLFAVIGRNYGGSASIGTFSLPLPSTFGVSACCLIKFQ